MMGLQSGNGLHKRNHRTKRTSKSVLPTTVQYDGSKSDSDSNSGNVYKNNIKYHYKRLRFKTYTKDVSRTIYTILKIIIAVILLYIVSFCAHLFLLSKQNEHILRDPCAVAMTSKQNLHKLMTEERNITDLRQTISNIQELTNEKSSDGRGNSDSNNSNNSEKTKPFEFKLEVPKIIHQQWKDDTIPQEFMEWHTKWLTLYPEPEYKHVLWTDDTGRQLIASHYPWFLETYDNYEHNINRADAIRYFILHHHGGIYADLYYEPMINFYNFLPQNQVGLVESPYYWNEQIQNSLLSSPKGDPFWLDLFLTLYENAAKKQKVISSDASAATTTTTTTTETTTTNPVSLLSQVVEISSHPSYILPCEIFQRVPMSEYDKEMTWTAMFLLRPIGRHCGDYSSDKCHFGKHHRTIMHPTTNTASV